MREKVGLIGYGHWGKNLARCFNELGVLKYIFEPDMEKRELAKRTYSHVEVKEYCVGEYLGDVDLDSVAVATPPETHYGIAQQVMNFRKDVFIEKPMTTSYIQAEALEKQARAQGRSLMVGHIYLHNGGIKLMPIPVGEAELYVQLLNEGGGPSASTRDVAWAGLPHACSLALHFFPDWPERIEAKREKDRIKVALGYWNDSMAYLDLGDNTGRKLRKVELREGDTRYLFDVSSPGHLKVESGTNSKDLGSDYKYEPLMEECKAFLEYEGVDHLGPKVVKLIEEILSECKS